MIKQFLSDTVMLFSRVNAKITYTFQVSHVYTLDGRNLLASPVNVSAKALRWYPWFVIEFLFMIQITRCVKSKDAVRYFAGAIHEYRQWHPHG